MKLTKEYLKGVIKETLQNEMHEAATDNTVNSLQELLNIIKSGGQFDPENDVGSFVVPAELLYQLKQYMKVK